MAESANDRFERRAAAFYDDTGMMAPGKDDGLGIDHYEDRIVAWRAWCAANPDPAPSPPGEPAGEPTREWPYDISEEELTHRIADVRAGKHVAHEEAMRQLRDSGASPAPVAGGEPGYLQRSEFGGFGHDALWDAYIAGVLDGKANPTCTPDLIERSADAYVKSVAPVADGSPDEFDGLLGEIREKAAETGGHTGALFDAAARYIRTLTASLAAIQEELDEKEEQRRVAIDELLAVSRALAEAKRAGECYTLPNGECGAPDPCIHTPASASVTGGESTRECGGCRDGHGWHTNAPDCKYASASPAPVAGGEPDEPAHMQGPTRYPLPGDEGSPFDEGTTPEEVW